MVAPKPVDEKFVSFSGLYRTAGAHKPDTADSSLTAKDVLSSAFAAAKWDKNEVDANAILDVHGLEAQIHAINNLISALEMKPNTAPSFSAPASKLHI